VLGLAGLEGKKKKSGRVGWVKQTHLFLLGFSDHVTCHVSDSFVDDFSHCGHDTFGLFTLESFSLESLHKVMCIEMKIGALRGGGK